MKYIDIIREVNRIVCVYLDAGWLLCGSDSSSGYVFREDLMMDGGEPTIRILLRDKSFTSDDGSSFVDGLVFQVIVTKNGWEAKDENGNVIVLSEKTYYSVADRYRNKEGWYSTDIDEAIQADKVRYGSYRRKEVGMAHKKYLMGVPSESLMAKIRARYGFETMNAEDICIFRVVGCIKSTMNDPLTYMVEKRAGVETSAKKGKKKTILPSAFTIRFKPREVTING